MIQAHLNRYALVALTFLVWASPAFAQEEATAPVEDGPEEQQEALEGEPSGGTEVIEVPPPEPTASESDPSQETDQEAEVESRVPGEQLRPEGEDEMMAGHPVDRGDISFKPGKGVEINSADDDFQLRIRVRVQFLYTLADGDVGPLALDEDDELRQDFRIRRARFIFQGHAFGKNNKYKLEVDPLRSDNVVLDYYLDFTQNKNVSVRVGQYKISSNRQRVISSGNLQMVDRSRVNAEFTLDRDMSIDIRSNDFLEKNKMRYVIGISSGNGLNRFEFSDFGMVYLIRIEYLPLGIFQDYTEVDFERTGPRISIAAGYAFFQNADRDRGMIGAPFPDEGTANYNFAYADVMFKARGFSALTEFALRSGTRNVGPNTIDPDGNPIPIVAPRNGLGWMLQAGYLIPNTRFEFSGRGSIIRKITSDTSLPNGYGATFALSYYFFRHPMKIQADVSQIWDEENFTEGSTVLRIQLQASL
ncbi:MAG: OprO/OprP family phosphate-selective porin [Myxococcales bacterium]|nr:OprO/OprP family phosphate-selective porin [Myxococcales bacterium]MDH3484136.1 OprO/OprP family phosphate-selective porin [Myxococcales bacterium]